MKRHIEGLKLPSVLSFHIFLPALLSAFCRSLPHGSRDSLFVHRCNKLLNLSIECKDDT